MVRYWHSWKLAIRNIRPDAIFALSVLFFLFSLVVTFSDFQNAVSPNSSLISREIAIAEARKNGQTTYSFETSFVPGLGMASESMLQPGLRPGEAFTLPEDFVPSTGESNKKTP